MEELETKRGILGLVLVALSVSVIVPPIVHSVRNDLDDADKKRRNIWVAAGVLGFVTGMYIVISEIKRNA